MIQKNFEQQFHDYVIKYDLLTSKDFTLVAVSGGVDSVVLAHLFATMHYPFAIAHCHFGLRPEAVEEQAFVAALAKRYKVPFYTTSFDTHAYRKAHKVSVQMAARELRYTWFYELLDKHHMGQIATAHHLNDAMETFIRNVAKGTGITGLHGILPRCGFVIHPLLFAHSKEVRRYAEACQLSWREDASNQDIKYERNFIRHKVIPELTVLNPNLEATFQTTLGRLQQVDKLFQAEVAKLRETLWRSEPPHHYIDVEKLLALPWAGVILEAWLSPFGFNFKQLEPWLHTPPQPGKKLYTATHWLLADRDVWVLGSLDNALKAGKNKATILSEGSDIVEEASIEKRGSSSLHVRQITHSIHARKGYTLPQGRYVAALDLASLNFPLILRSWREGDVFYPLTCKKRFRKKISNLLIDAKVPLHKKGAVKVVVSGDEIVWVVGHQVDDRFKVTDDTEKVFEIVYEPFSTT